MTAPVDVVDAFRRVDALVAAYLAEDDGLVGDLVTGDAAPTELLFAALDTLAALVTGVARDADVDPQEAWAAWCLSERLEEEGKPA